MLFYRAEKFYFSVRFFRSIRVFSRTESEVLTNGFGFRGIFLPAAFYEQ